VKKMAGTNQKKNGVYRNPEVNEERDDRCLNSKSPRFLPEK
ncbi:hypothetical protein LCGC14_2251830, partial [marine sediment metagenome]